jgi:hypothetical protein
MHSDSQGPSKQADHNVTECLFHPEVPFSLSQLYQFTFIVLHEIPIVYIRDKLNQMNEFQSYMIDFMFQYVFLNILSLTNFNFLFPNMNHWFRHYKNVISEVLMVVIMKFPVLWDVLLCNLTSHYNIYWTGCVTAMLKTCLWKVLDSDTGYPDWGFYGFLKSLQTNAGIVSQLDHDCFLPHVFNFISHLIIWCCIDSVLTALLNNQLKWNSQFQRNMLFLPSG